MPFLPIKKQIKSELKEITNNKSISDILLSSFFLKMTPIAIANIDEQSDM
jgi:hypothetical protein